MERFFGRERELEAIAEARRSASRLVTLLGPPGIGKTRLVRRYLEDVSAEGGVHFCDLTPARGAEDMAAAVARALDVRRVEDAASAIADAGPIVLALDNLEVIAKEAAPIIADWCARAPEAFFVATSRVKLGLSVEHVIDVPPRARSRAEFLPTP